MNRIFMTKATYDRLQQQLKIAQQKLIAAGKEAGEAGGLNDWHDNPGLESAQHDIAMYRGQIVELEAKIADAEIIIPSPHTNQVGLGHTVTIEFGNETETYTIVGSEDSDPVQGFISNESPLGRALLGHRPGDKVVVELPDGQETLLIKQIKQIQN